MRYLLIVILGFIPHLFIAQQLQGGIQTGISYEWEQFKGKWEVSATPFIHFFQSETSEKLTWISKIDQIDVDLRYTKKLGKNWSGTAGYQWKPRTPFESYSVDHSFTLYASLDDPLAIGKLSHRFRLEQRYKEKKSWVFRPRYRLTWQRPIMADKTENQAWYILASDELVAKFKNAPPVYENRISVILRKIVRQNNAYELGIEHRLKGFTGRSKHQLYLVLGYSFG